VILNLEDELDGVLGRSTDTAWSETEISIGATNNDLNSGSIGRERGGTRGVLRTSLELGADCKSSVLEVGEGVGGTVTTTIDGADHPSSAMAVRSVCSLITEHPDRLSVVHGDGKGGPIRRGNIGTNWLETRVKTAILEGTRASK